MSIQDILIQGVLVVAVFYFVLHLPNKKREKERKAMLDNLKKNDEIVTSSGIHGTVVIVKEKTVVVRVDDNCRIEFDKESVITIKSNSVKPEVIK